MFVRREDEEDDETRCGGEEKKGRAQCCMAGCSPYRISPCRRAHAGAPGLRRPRGHSAEHGAAFLAGIQVAAVQRLAARMKVKVRGSGCRLAATEGTIHYGEREPEQELQHRC